MIVVVGSINIDLIAAVPHLPAKGETVLALGMARLPGGKGANQAVAAARAGGEVVMVGCVGEDAEGRESIESLQSVGADTSHVRRDASAPTGVAYIAVDADGENTIVVASGANRGLSPHDVDAAADSIGQSSAVLLQLEISLETVVHTARVARERGVPVILNPAPSQALPPELLKAVDLLVPNRGELAMLTGMGSPVDAGTAARMLASAGPASIVVTQGSEGVTVVSGDGTVEIDAPAVDAVDTTGAGDCFVGNLAYALDRGEGLADAARFAVHAAALCVTRPGAQPSMPAGDETRAFMAETGL